MQLLNNNPIYRLLIPKPVRTFFWKKFLSSKIINSYKDSNDEDIKEIILNIKKNGIQIISSTLSQEYDASKIKVYYDEIKNLKDKIKRTKQKKAELQKHREKMIVDFDMDYKTIEKRLSKEFPEFVDKSTV